MLTINQCREILVNEATKLTDDEIIIMRDWLMMMADIALESIEKEEAITSMNEFKIKQHEQKSNTL